MSPEEQALLTDTLRQQPDLRAVTIDVGSEPNGSGSVQLTTLTETYLNKNIFQREDLGGGFYRMTFLLPIGNRYVITAKGVFTSTRSDGYFQMIIEISEAQRDLLLTTGLKPRFIKGNFTILWANEAACVHFHWPAEISTRERRFQVTTKFLPHSPDA